MIPQMHNDKTQGKEQLLPPFKNKPIATPLVEKPSQPTPATPRRWIGVLLLILGILLPLAGGFLAGWPWYRFGHEGDFIPPLPFWGTVLSLVVGAALLRSWWAVLIVPVVWSAGSTLAGDIIRPTHRAPIEMQIRRAHVWTPGTLVSPTPCFSLSNNTLDTS